MQTQAVPVQNPAIAAFPAIAAERYPNGYPTDHDLMQLATDLRQQLTTPELAKLVGYLVTGTGGGEID